MEAMLRRLIGEDIVIETHLDPDLFQVQADPGQISQILMNLTANARDAMPGGGKIVVRTANWFVEKDRFHTQLGFTPGRYVRLSFTDTGEGMDPETCKHIFEPFFTDEGSRQRYRLRFVHGIRDCQTGRWSGLGVQPARLRDHSCYLSALLPDGHRIYGAAGAGSEAGY